MNDRAAAMRSVMVDGSSRGRVEGHVIDLALSEDGRYVYVSHRSLDQRRNLVTRVALDDGERRRLAASTRFGKSHLSRVSTSGRVFDLPPRGRSLTWRDPDGRSGALELDADERVHAISPDGALAALCRGDDALRVVEVASATTRHALSAGVGPRSAEGTLHERFVVHKREPGELRRLRLADGDAQSVAPVRFNYWNLPGVYVVDRAGTRVAVTRADRVEVLALDDLRVVASVEIRDFQRFYDFVGDTLLTFCFGDRASVVAYDLATGSSFEVPVTPRSGALRLAPDARAVVFVAYGAVRRCDLERGRLVGLHDGPDAPAARLAWSRDGSRLAAVCFDDTVRVLDTRRREVEWTFEGATSADRYASSMEAVFSPDGRWLYAVSARSVVTWSLATGHEVARAPMPEGSWYGVAAISPDGRWIATVLSRDRVAVSAARPQLALIDAHAGTLALSKSTLPYVREWATRLRFTSDDELQWVVRHANHRGEAAIVRVGLDGATRSVARRGFRASAQVVAIDEERLLVLDRGRWWVSSGAQRSTGNTVPGLALDAALDAEAGLAAFGARDAEREGVVVVDVETGEVLGLAWTARAAIDGAFSPDGEQLAVRYADGGVEVFALG